MARYEGTARITLTVEVPFTVDASGRNQAIRLGADMDEWHTLPQDAVREAIRVWEEVEVENIVVLDAERAEGEE